MKEIFFLSGMPRAGNTLLGSIINQNKQITVTAQSIVLDMVHNLSLMKENLIFKNFPDYQSFNNVFKNIFNHYYKDFEAKYIIDRGPWGTPGNLKALKQIIDKPKFIILYRPVLEVLSSFIDLEKPHNIEKRCNDLMNINKATDAIIDKYLYSIHNIIKEKEDYLVVHYNDLVNNPLKEIKNIFSFLNVPCKEITLDKINQFTVNDIMYDDSIFSIEYHKIKTNKIEKTYRDINKILPEKIISKYSNKDIIF